MRTNAGLSMSDVAESGATAGSTAGGLLREARQAAGMHIAALAVALKVPVSKLEALEADNYAALPDTVFVRALASSVCRTLKVDSGPILALLPQSQSPRLAANSAGLNAPVKASVSRAAASLAPYPAGTKSRSVTFVVLALLLAALVVFLFPREHGMSLIPPVRMGSSASDAGAAGAPATEAAAPTVLASEPTAAGTTAALAVRDGTTLPAVAPKLGASGAGVDASATAAAPNDALAGSSATLVLRARGQSWVQVKDGAGAVVLQRNLAVDESVSVDAPPPLAVIIGRADATEVLVRGKPFSLLGVSRENVARFEVK